MPVTAEEEVVLLYALYACGRRPSKARATHFILTSHLFKEREGDSQRVSTGESRVENRIAWTRENLKRKGEMEMPEHGTWAITEKGMQRIERVALKSVTGMIPGMLWDRLSDELIKRLQVLGNELKQRSEKKGEQNVPGNGSQPS